MKVGLITYHSAYNFGSALQAYATQCAIRTMTSDVEIINYRMEEQKNIYSLYRTKYGIKTAIKDVMQIPAHKKRVQRMNAFEKFFSEYLHLSEELSMPDEVSELWNMYDIVISGSDQIWNKHSLELEHNSWDYMNPYLLKGFKGKKVSYASSVGNMTDGELDKIIPEICDFSSIAMREKSSAEHIAKLTGMKIENVLDPTFLLNSDQWTEAFNLKNNDENYILFYSLGSIKQFFSSKDVLENLSEKYGVKIKFVMPFLYVPLNSKHFEIHPEYGPIEFLNEIYNAKAVITDSYHGTILSINFGKDVYSLCKKGGSHFRKTDILERLGLSERIIYNPQDLLHKKYKEIDYVGVYSQLNKLREYSLRYLQNALEEK